MATGSQTDIQKAIVETKSAQVAQFAPEPEAVKALVNRFASILSYRGAEKLTDKEKITLAFNSLAYNLNPALGEIWAVPGYGIMVGRAGWVKKLTEKAAREDFRWWDQYTKLRPDEMKEWGIDPEKVRLAYLCEIRRSDTLSAYTNMIKGLAESVKLTYEQLIDMMGKPPVTRGVGVIYTHEDFGNKNMMTEEERCRKRAFAQCCRQVVELPFAAGTEGDKANGGVVDSYEVSKAEVVDGEAVEVPQDAPSKPQPAQDSANGTKGADTHEEPAAPQEAAQGKPAVTVYERLPDPMPIKMLIAWFIKRVADCEAPHADKELTSASRSDLHKLFRKYFEDDERRKSFQAATVGLNSITEMQYRHMLAFQAWDSIEDAAQAEVKAFLELPADKVAELAAA